MIPHPWMQFHAHPSTFARRVVDLSPPSRWKCPNCSCTPKPRHLIIFLENPRSRHDSPPVDAVSRPAKHLCPPSCRLVVAVHFLFKFLQQHRVLWLLFPCFCQRQPEGVILAEDAIIDLSVRRTAASLALPGQHPTETSTSTDSPTQVVCGSHNVFVRSTENVDCCCLCGATAIDGNDS